ncbi:MAG: T9SS type A sorting domain-containing protein [Flavipsychrobacter sp.]|nr:T9SS type A sorting domain-containing protein [Flavipsychrobacter sp.]
MKKLLLFLSLLYDCKLSAQTQIQVLVNSRNTSSVQKYDINGNYLGDFIAGNSGGLREPQDILFHPDGSVLVTGVNNSTIKRYDGITGAFLGNFSTGYILSLPTKMCYGPDSLIYVTQWGADSDKVVRFNLQGAFVDEFTSKAIPKGLSMVWDKNKNLYVAAYSNGANGTVHKFDSLGNDLGVFINSAILQGPTNIWFDNTGDMLVADWTLGKVHRYDSAGNYKSNFITGLTNPEGIDFLPDGRMLISDWGTDNVHLVNTNGIIAGVFCSGNGLNDPNCVRIREVSTTGVAKLHRIDMSVVPTIGTQFHISIPGNKKLVNIILTNAMGQMIKTISTTSQTILDAQGLPDGMYYLNAEGTVTKIVVSKR